jgi:hypothetical protein
VSGTAHSNSVRAKTERDGVSEAVGGVIDDSDAKLRAAIRDTCRQSALADVPIDDTKGIPLELVLLGGCAVGLAICAHRLWRRFWRAPNAGGRNVLLAVWRPGPPAKR